MSDYANNRLTTGQMVENALENFKLNLGLDLVNSRDAYLQIRLGELFDSLLGDLEVVGVNVGEVL